MITNCTLNFLEFIFRAHMKIVHSTSSHKGSIIALVL